MEETKKDIKNSKVTFSPEQMELLQQMFVTNRDAKDVNTGREAISMFANTRDPKELMTCPIYRFDGQFVLGFEDYNHDPYRSKPKYYDLKLDINRKLADQPFVTLLLSNDGETITKKEVPVIDYMRKRIKVVIEKPNFKVIEKTRLEDHGLISPGNGTFAQEMVTQGKFVQPTLVKSESKHVDRVFVINLPGFKEPVEIIEAFLA